MAEAPSSEDIVKHAKSTLVQGDWVDGIAFLPRAEDNDGSSVNRLAVFSNDPDVAMVEVRLRTRLTLRAGHRFAQINIGDLKAAVVAITPVVVVSDPLPEEPPYPEDKSHALIQGLPPKGLMDDLIGDLISRKVKRLHLALLA